MKTALALCTVLAVALVSPWTQARNEEDSPWSDERFAGLEFRSIGPAFMSGRIADIAIHPEDDNLWYVAVGSGGVWKTENAGVTWTPIFDDQGSYSIGCVTIDPSNPHTVWVGTGENVGGRHIGYGDGIYRSDDGGTTWKNMGLGDSQHISKILVNPNNSDVVLVAVQGPLWNKGGQRGVYLSKDGGNDWARVLGDEEWTGATDLVMDPRDPNRVYAATWQRHRNVAAYLGGGPGSGLHRSTDGGMSWEPLTEGLPESNLGKIGLAISPQHPDVLYAAIELDRRTGALYRSTDRGSTWEKRSDTVSGGTGPHYYQELYASPHQFDRLYLADVRVQVSEDGGKTFTRMKETHKHSDNHAMAFRPDDPDYLLVGSDGGLYESFDLAQNWRFFDNLPVTQFYKLALDDAEPFYNIYGGTQDNSTEGGPSRTDNAHGIQNSDWKVVLDWDGHQPATEPGNPNILYAERQEGYLARVDLTTGEIVDIQPQPEPGEPFERFNWDAPILVSPHSPTRLYFASYRVWRSDNRGDEWSAISGDLTRDQERLELPIMGGPQSWDNPWDVSAMSTYNTITSLAESPLQAGLLYVGTDDGLLQVSEDGGANWRRIEVGSLPGVPETAFVNDVRADLFDANTVYVALDNHKFGDFEPYLLRSDDRGMSWRSIRSNLPERTLVWRLVQDHVRSELLFVATEFGVHFSVNRGERWTKITGGVPNMSFRDLTIHRRDDDLVGATFGRGFYVFDDIRPFRGISDDQLAEQATLFPTRDAWWYFPRPHLGFEGGKGDQGASHYVASNPPFGAVFTYYLREGLKSAQERRVDAEKNASEEGKPAQFPGWDALEAERLESGPEVWLTVRDAGGRVVRRIPGPVAEGFHRVSWDLRYPTPDAVSLVEPPPPMWGGPPRGQMAAPGKYTVSLSQQMNGVVTELSAPQTFEVIPLRKGALEGASPDQVAAFWREYEAAVRIHSAMLIRAGKLATKLERLGKAIQNSRTDVTSFDPRVHQLRKDLLVFQAELNGPPRKQETGEKYPPIVGDRLFAVSRGIDRSTYGPTATTKRSLEIANAEIETLNAQLQALEGRTSELIKELVEAGGPWLEGER